MHKEWTRYRDDPLHTPKGDFHLYETQVKEEPPGVLFLEPHEQKVWLIVVFLFGQTRERQLSTLQMGEFTLLRKAQ